MFCEFSVSDGNEEWTFQHCSNSNNSNYTYAMLLRVSSK